MELLIELDRTGARPLRDQLYDRLRLAVGDGRLRAGARVPPTRALAVQLGVSRFTVEDAYARLVAEGYLEGRHGSGTFVLDGAATASAEANRTAAAGGMEGPPPSRRWSAWGARLVPPVADRQPAAGTEPRFAFRSGMPALDAFPHAVWNRLLMAEARAASPPTRDYGPSAGYPPLREAIAGYLARSRGLAADPARVVVTSGTRQSLDLLARLWLDPGAAVAIEEPGYAAGRCVFEAAGARLVPVPVDGEGLRIGSLTTLGDGARLVYVTPSHQYPTGGVLPLARRGALLAWARERGALVVEDDYDAEFRYGARPVPALAGLDDASSGKGRPGSVVYLGTFSKVLYPSLRMGYAVLPSDMVERFVAAKVVADHHSPTATQAALAAFIGEGHFERHLARMRRLYAGRRAALTGALAEFLPHVARREPVTEAAGLHLLVSFDVPFSEEELLARASRAGVLLDGAGACYAAAAPRWPSVLMGYAPLTDAEIRAGVRALAGALVS